MPTGSGSDSLSSHAQHDFTTEQGIIHYSAKEVFFSSRCPWLKLNSIKSEISDHSLKEGFRKNFLSEADFTGFTRVDLLSSEQKLKGRSQSDQPR